MKNFLASTKLGPIQELSREAQKQLKGGSLNNPCCQHSPYFTYNATVCAQYTAAGGNGAAGCN